MNIAYLQNFAECPSNPARCFVPTGDIEINLHRWNELTEPQREFVLQHEIGHYANQTFEETEADDFALQQLALKKPYSLTNFIDSVKEVSHNDSKRVRNAQYNALQIAAREGDKEAKQVLSLFANAEGDTFNKYSWLLPIGLALVLAFLLYHFTK